MCLVTVVQPIQAAAKPQVGSFTGLSTAKRERGPEGGERVPRSTSGGLPPSRRWAHSLAFLLRSGGKVPEGGIGGRHQACPRHAGRRSPGVTYRQTLTTLIPYDIMYR